MMKIVRGISHWNYCYKRPVVAIGVFDGLHHGHRQLIQKMKQRSKAINGTPIVVTFHPHPAKRLHPQRKLPLITSLDYRLKLIEDQGVCVCLVINFTRRFAEMDPDRFVEQYLVRKLRAAEIVVGEDFRFGHHRRGNVALFKRLGEEKGFKVHEIPVRKFHGEKTVSSTHIRRYLKNADISNAQKMLDRPVAIMGRVVKGDRRGRGLGFPTANLDAKLTGFAPRGVYCVRVHVNGQELIGMANIGSRPSFKKNALPNIEVHIFDFNKTLYGRTILIEFVKKIRDEKKFSSQKNIIEQLQRDEIFARRWFSSHL